MLRLILVGNLSVSRAFKSLVYLHFEDTNQMRAKITCDVATQDIIHMFTY